MTREEAPGAEGGLPPPPVSLLRTYLQDHLTGAAGGRALAARARDHARAADRELLREVVLTLDDDFRTLKEVIRQLGHPPNPLRTLMGRAMEKMSRMKPSLLLPTTLRHVQELEGLLIGSRGRQALWQTLALVYADRPWSEELEFPRRELRAAQQCDQLSIARDEAARLAFSF